MLNICIQSGMQTHRKDHSKVGTHTNMSTHCLRIHMSSKENKRQNAEKVRGSEWERRQTENKNKSLKARSPAMITAKQYSNKTEAILISVLLVGQKQNLLRHSSALSDFVQHPSAISLSYNCVLSLWHKHHLPFISKPIEINSFVLGVLHYIIKWHLRQVEILDYWCPANTIYQLETINVSIKFHWTVKVSVYSKNQTDSWNSPLLIHDLCIFGC